MDHRQWLTPDEAEQVVSDLIERFGNGALPELRISVERDGRWRVRWDEFERVIEPMSMDAWRSWLEAHVGSLSPEALVTTES